MSDTSKKNSVYAMIPARYAATRFPGKLMQLLGNKTVIRHVYDNTIATRLFDDVIVVTDSDQIFREIVSNGGKAIMSKKKHESGSDRIAEAIADIDADIIINVQGDEPFIKKEPLENLIRLFDDPVVRVASLMRKSSYEEALDRNSVKVVVDKNNDALFFSRSIIPYRFGGETTPQYFYHLGVYAYTKEMLLAFTQWPVSPAERSEKLEQLRYLENAVKIRMAETDYNNIAIDSPEDLEKAQLFLKNYNG